MVLTSTAHGLVKKLSNDQLSVAKIVANSKIRVEIVKTFELYAPTLTFDKVESKIPFTNQGEINFYGKSQSNNFVTSWYHHFPVIVDCDGSPWSEANRYLLSKLTGVVPPKYRTLESIARDLAHFREWLTNEDVDFLYIADRPRSRPTYRYCAHLHDELRLSKIKANTAKRRMSAVQSFYRWLIEDGYEFEFPLWIERDANIFFKNSQGFQSAKSYKSTDLTSTFKASQSSNDYSNQIEDGGRLRPLPKVEQIALVESLKRIGNIEMLLSFLLAITTGARLQTVFTLRQKHFKQKLSNDLTYHRLKVGSGTLVNTKNGKQMVLLVPIWLCKRVQIYLNSERYLTRSKRSGQECQGEKQYAFLTKAGKPYYISSQDERTVSYRTPPRGNAITQFIRQQLKPDLLAHGHHFDVSFHDLRATFGMNLLEGKLLDYKLGGVAASNQPEFFQLLMYVRERMGHTQLSTTEAYLNYRQKYHLALHVQSEYELYLEKLVNQAEVAVDLG